MKIIDHIGLIYVKEPIEFAKPEPTGDKFMDHIANLKAEREYEKMKADHERKAKARYDIYQNMIAQMRQTMYKSDEARSQRNHQVMVSVLKKRMLENKQK